MSTTENTQNNSNDNSSNEKAGKGFAPEDQKKKRGRGRPKGVKNRKKRKTYGSRNQPHEHDSEYTIVKQKNFRLAGKKLFLTYPQCNLDIDFVLRCVYNILSAYGVKDYVCVNELHSDGNQHKHIMINLRKRLDRKDPNCLDIRAYTIELEPRLDETGAQIIDPTTGNHILDQVSKEKVYHGNYGVVKSENNALEYITKDIFNSQDAIQNLRMSPGYQRRLGQLYEHISLSQRMMALADAGCIDQAMDLLRTEDPDLFLTKGRQMEERLGDIYLKNLGVVPRFKLEDYYIPPEMKEAIDLFLQSQAVQETKTFVLKGDSGSGKTTFMIALLQSLGKSVCLVNNKEGLKNFKESKHTAILFDDPSFRHETREDLIHLVDNIFQSIRIRYTNANIPADTLKAITTNVDLKKINPSFGDPALKRRLIEYRIPKGQKLFTNKPPETAFEQQRQEFLDSFEKYKNEKEEFETDDDDI
jgi:DNA replication protein DnaC